MGGLLVTAYPQTLLGDPIIFTGNIFLNLYIKTCPKSTDIHLSRFTEHDCVALFLDRAVPKLSVQTPIALDVGGQEVVI